MEKQAIENLYFNAKGVLTESHCDIAFKFMMEKSTPRIYLFFQQ